ncbi:hypothetical protein [Tistrella mobilis]
MHSQTPMPDSSADEERRIDLSVRDSEAFVRALTDPQPLEDRLSDTIRRYRRRTGV